MTSPADSVTLQPWHMNRLQRRLAAGAALVVLADFLFYGHHLGVSVALFVAVLCACSVATNASDASRGEHRNAAIVLAAALLPLVEDVNAISLLLAGAGAGGFVLRLTRQRDVPPTRRARSIVRLYAIGPWQLISDLLREQRIAARRQNVRVAIGRLIVWTVPVIFCGIFLALLTSANPVIDLWISKIDLVAIFAGLSIPRILLWVFVLCLAWPFLRVKPHPVARRVAIPMPPDPGLVAARATLLSSGAILRSLWLFNLLFAVETGLDAVYLWGGAALPDGMSYASYAHRGAYPLVVTALLAAAFVLVALRPGSAAERNATIRVLVVAWVAQNVLLVVSAMLRLDLYVAVYSLTRLRAAAFVWMVLVVAGLSLIILRILLSRSNAWLVKANLRSLVATLYLCSLTNFASIIADYNVTHSQEISGRGTPLDLDYLVYNLGPQALPAIDRFLKLRAGQRDLDGEVVGDLRWPAACRAWLAEANAATHENWRAWSFRGERLWRYQKSARNRVIAAASLCYR